jgi:hypothetical protein
VDGLQTLNALAADHPSLSVGGGVAVNLYIRAGWTHANRQYALVATGSGTAPGTPIGAVTVPINVDPITQAVLANMNTPLFSNFLGTTNSRRGGCHHEHPSGRDRGADQPRLRGGLPEPDRLRDEPASRHVAALSPR